MSCLPRPTLNQAAPRTPFVPPRQFFGFILFSKSILSALRSAIRRIVPVSLKAFTKQD
jgi:hypothetical protein